MSMDVKGKRVLVCGMARSGIAAAKLLLSKGALVTISDTKAESEFGSELDKLRVPACTFALGQPADSLTAGQDIMVISPGIAWRSLLCKTRLLRALRSWASWSWVQG